MHGHAKEALHLFNSMLKQGIIPTAITFTCVLSACSHAGFVQQAWNIFSSMKEQFGLEPDTNHQACMIDVWGRYILQLFSISFNNHKIRAGMLDHAENFILNLPEQNLVFWQTLLGASHNHGDIERTIRVATKIWEQDCNNPVTYVLLANTYAAAGRWQEQQMIWNLMKDNNIKKIPGATWVTVHGESVIFYANSQHPYHNFKFNI